MKRGDQLYVENMFRVLPSSSVEALPTSVWPLAGTTAIASAWFPAATSDPL